jgi:hypothetical protein
LEVVWRTIVELIGATDLILLPIGGILFSREFLDAAAAGQFLGFLLLGIAAFQALPEVFPERYLGWGNDVTSRILITGGVVVAASLFNGFVGQLPFLDGGVFAPVTTVAVVIGVSSVAGFLTVVYGSISIPQIRPFPDYVRYRPQDTVSPVVPPVGLLVSRVVMILIFGGLALAIVSRLYPLPELFFVGVTIYAGLSGPTTMRADIAEGFISGLRAVWGGRDGVIGVSYGVGGLLFVLWLGVALTVGLENRAEVISDPTTLLFGVITLGLGTVHGTVSLVRLIERLPNAVGTGETDTANKPLIPGLLLPAGALFGLYVGVSTLRDNSVYLSATLPELALALALGTIAVVTLYRPSIGPSVPISDYLRIVLAPSLLFAIWGTSAYRFGGNLSLVSDGGPVINLIVVLCIFTLFPLSPFLGYELFSTGDDTSKTADLSNLISEAISAASVFLVAVIISYVLNEAASLLPFGEILRLIGGVIVIIPLAGILIRAVMVLFYLPEQITNWLK